MAPTSVPTQSGPPWWGQRLRTREVLAADVEDADRAALDLDDLAAAGGDLAGLGDDVAANRGLGSRRRLQAVQRARVLAHDASRAGSAVEAAGIAWSGESKSQCG